MLVDNLDIENFPAVGFPVTLTDAMAGITDLSLELIAHILYFSEWPAYLQLALTCRRLAHYSQRLMTRHSESHKLYSATSDIQPMTLHTLARALLKDPVAISHVLALEFWGERSTFSDWNPHTVHKLESIPARPYADQKAGVEAMSLMFHKHEIEAFEKIMQQKIRLSADASKAWKEKIEVGDDGALKGMLIALCPNLKAVRFVRYTKPASAQVTENEETPFR